jgi:membrane protein
VERGHQRLERERERRVAVDLGVRLLDRGRRIASSTLAGALAFRLFLVLLPLTLVAVVGLGYLNDAGGTPPSEALRQFGVKGVLASTIDQQASFHDPGRAAVLLLGILGVLMGARNAVRALRAIHAIAWGVPVVRWRRGGRAAIVFLVIVVIGFACGGLATRVRTEVGVGLGFGASVALAGVVAAVWLGVSCLLPHREGVRWTAFVPGAVLVGAGFAVLQAVTADWLGPKLNQQSALYGSLGVAFVILGWLYVLGRLLVAAPLLNAAVAEHREPKHRRAAARDAT